MTSPIEHGLRLLDALLRSHRRRGRTRRADRAEYLQAFGLAAEAVWHREQSTPWHPTVEFVAPPSGRVQIRLDGRDADLRYMAARAASGLDQLDDAPVSGVDTGELRLALRQRIAQVEATRRVQA